MSVVMSVRLHLSGVRVRGVLVDSVDRLEVESTRQWSRCPHCGFGCHKVWDRRAKRVRDLEVSGRRRFCCDSCGNGISRPQPVPRRAVSPFRPSLGERCQGDVDREPVSWFLGSTETRDVFCSCRHIAVNSPVGGLVDGGWLATDSVAVG